MLLSSKPFTFDRVVRLLITVGFFVVVIWLLNVLSDALLPFFVACLLAYVFKPFVEFNKKVLHVKSNVLPIVLFLIEMIGVVFLFFYLLVPVIIDEFVVVANLVKDYANSSSNQNLPVVVDEFVRKYIDFEHLKDFLTKEQWMTLIKNTLQGTWSFVSGSISVILTVASWFIVLLYFIFILLDYDNFVSGLKRLIPDRYEKMVFKVVGDVKYSMNKYFRGQALIAFLVGVLFSIGFSLIGMPMAIVMGMFIGFLNLVPYLQLISIPPTIFLCVIYSAETGTSFWQIFALAMLVYIVVQAIQDLYLTPKIMGKFMGLNPAIILLSLSIWGTLLGFIGLIIALPLTTLVLSYYNRYVIEVDKEYSNNYSNNNKDELLS